MAKDCCKVSNKDKKCIRKDGKEFSLPRRFSKKRCMNGPVNGFTMRSSCAPYSMCNKMKDKKKYKSSKTKKKKRKRKNYKK